MQGMFPYTSLNVCLFNVFNECLCCRWKNVVLMCFPYLLLLPMTYFLLQTYLCDVYDHNMPQQIMLPVLSHQGMMHECHLDMTKRNLFSEFLEL